MAKIPLNGVNMKKNDPIKSPITNETTCRHTVISRNASRKFVELCAWCEGPKKKYTKQWIKKGYKVSHGICEDCEF